MNNGTNTLARIAEQEARHRGEADRSAFDTLAESYHLLIPDLDDLMDRQTTVVSKIIQREFGDVLACRILDPATGIGPVALGLACRGHAVTCSDISPVAVARVREEASKRGIRLRVVEADMRNLSFVDDGEFDVIVLLGNSLCMVSTHAELNMLLSQIWHKLRPGGVLIVGVRDYDRAIQIRPLRADQPKLFFDRGKWRIVHQVWHWIDSRRYLAHVFVSREDEDPLQYSMPCRAVVRDELLDAIRCAGFEFPCWAVDDNSASDTSVYDKGFDELILTAKRPRGHLLSK